MNSVHTVHLYITVDSQHKFKSLKKSEEQLTKDYSRHIKEISIKHSEFCKKQKVTQALFADLLVNYNEEEKLKAVDRVAEQQVGFKLTSVKTLYLTPFATKSGECRIVCSCVLMK